MFTIVPEGFKRVTIKFKDAPAASVMQPIPAGSVGSDLQFSDKSIYSVHTGDLQTLEGADLTTAVEHCSGMRAASGQQPEHFNPIPACIVGGYTPKAVKFCWTRIGANSGGAADAAVESAYCTAMYSLQKRPSESIPIEVLVPVGRSISITDVYTATGLAAALKG